ncbi:hypothetical protein [Serratia sp. M24T3]|uniref:hypothetical protein n=1 Tax=Serratia sp. M24T3 TaxID=932213 RepID=UPI00025B8F40|nr:hypothetical protein [Serratia sp. M24T3]EIC83990.1 hypothetical protein SPM24T3_13775 [Serratia sp. M24T3]
MAAEKIKHVRMNNPHGIEFSLSNGKVIKINGNAVSLIGVDKGKIPVGLYGKTEIPAVEWEALLKEYGKTKLFRNELIVAADDFASAEDMARERIEKRHGREPIDTSTTITQAEKVAA